MLIVSSLVTSRTTRQATFQRSDTYAHTLVVAAILVPVLRVTSFTLQIAPNLDRWRLPGRRLDTIKAVTFFFGQRHCATAGLSEN